MIKRYQNFLLAIFTCIVLAVGFYFALLKNNIHTVIPQVVYRSAQLNGGDLTYVLKKYHIQSVINLRGSGPGQYWYDNELNEENSFKINIYNISLKAKSIVTVGQLKQLVETIEQAPKPVLIHCKDGADRTGLAAAIALILYQHPDINAIKNQYSLKYLAVSPDTNGKLTLPYYFCWLEKNQLSSSRDNFLRWIGQLKPGINFPSKDNELSSKYLVGCHV